MRLAVAIAAAVVLASTSALAQAPGQVDPVQLPAPAAPQKDPGTAVAISLGATAGSFALLVAGASNQNGSMAMLGFVGMYFGPSLGVWYGGGTGLVGLGGRLAGLLMFVHGLELDANTGDYECDGLSSADCGALASQAADQERTAELWAYGGLALWGAATIYDFVDAHRSASRWNREHQLTLAPMLSPHSTGMALALRF